MRIVRLLALFSVLVCSLATHARADATQPGYRQHDGFFLRLSLGHAIGGTQLDDQLGAANALRTVGVGGDTEVAVGYAVIPDLILHANLNLAHVTGRRKVGRDDWDEDHHISTLMGFVGVGATYYFMPINVYISGAIGPGGISQTQGPNHEHFESNTGFGTSLSVGREWWMGRSGQWAIGAALHTAYYQAPFEQEGHNTQYRGYVTGLAFTASYN